MPQTWDALSSLSAPKLTSNIFSLVDFEIAFTNGMALPSYTYGTNLARLILLNPDLDEAGPTHLQALLAHKFNRVCGRKNIRTHQVAS